MGGSVRRAPRTVAVLGVAAMLAMSATTSTASPIRTPAAGSSATPGSAWAWGDNFNGQLGNGTTSNSSTPVVVSLPAGTTVTAIAGGGYHSLALTSTGRVLAWGYNSSGQLGNGTTIDSSTPVAVSLPAGTTVIAIAGGGYHSLALTSTGQVLAWGANNDGQLGDGTTTLSSTPVAVSLPTGTNVAAIAGGILHSLAVTATGRVLAWGYNVFGQLGNGTTTTSSTPIAVSRIMNTGSASTAVQVTYYDAVTGSAIGAQTETLAPHAFWGLYQPTGGLPSGTRATALITTSSGGQVAAICNESSSTSFMSYDGQ